jgi:5'-3' exonuclease
MGIPAYFISLLRKNSKLLTKFNNDIKVNGLYFDSNSIIYDVIHDIESKNNTNNNNDKNNMNNTIISNEVIYKLVCEKLELYIKIINPANEIFISFDGVAPVAKMEQQRQRRYKSQLIKNIKLSTGIDDKNKFDTNQITPGTKFMTDLCVYINKYFNNKTINANIILNLSDIPGEGEHKIYNYIRNNHNKLVNKYNNKNYSHFVYGLDSDLIMLSLINYDIVNNIYLLRETPHFIQNINKNYLPNSLYFINFNHMKNIITYNIHQDDYVLLGFILGNDFIPHNPCFNIRHDGLNIIMKIYKETFPLFNTNLRFLTSITNNNVKHINWNNLKLFFINLSKIEKKELETIINNKHVLSKQRHIINKEMSIDDRLNYIPKLNFNIEYNIFNDSKWKNNYYKSCLNINYNNKAEVYKISMNYIDALRWNFNYYTQNNIDYLWSYNYNFSPLISDIIQYIHDFEEFDELKTSYNSDNINNIHFQTQLAYVLPRESYKYVNKKIRNYILNNKPYVINHKMTYNYAFSTYLWEGHLDLNYININELDLEIKEQLHEE